MIKAFTWHKPDSSGKIELCLHVSRQLKSALASLTRKERKENKSHKSSGGQRTGLKILDPLQKGLLLACVYPKTVFSLSVPPSLVRGWEVTSYRRGFWGKKEAPAACVDPCSPVTQWVLRQDPPREFLLHVYLKIPLQK